jgi:hypothetical protein
MDMTKEQHQILCISQKNEIETLTMIRQGFGSENMSRIRKDQTQRDRKSKTGKEQSQEHAHSLTSRELLKNNSSWQTILSILHTAVIFHGKCVKMCEDFTKKFWRQKNWLLHHDNALTHTSFSTGNF